MKLVISLGGSVIVPNQIDVDFLKKFEKVIDKIKKGNKIIIVTGGGSTARKYIGALKEKKSSNRILSYIGYKITRVNALLLSGFLDAPMAETMSDVKRLIHNKNVIVSGALDFDENGTSDGTAADVAKSIKADVFINITNVKGLYDKDPKKYNNAKFVSYISFNDFKRKANKIKYKAGQHFVLDQRASKIIGKNKIKTVIIRDISNLIKIVKGEKVTGTVING